MPARKLSLVALAMTFRLSFRFSSDFLPMDSSRTSTETA